MTTTERTTYLPDDVNTLSWAAEQLHISRASAYRLARRDKVPGLFRVGRSYRVSTVRFWAIVHGGEDDA